MSRNLIDLPPWRRKRSPFFNKSPSCRSNAFSRRRRANSFSTSSAGEPAIPRPGEFALPPCQRRQVDPKVVCYLPDRVPAGLREAYCLTLEIIRKVASYALVHKGLLIKRHYQKPLHYCRADVLGPDQCRPSQPPASPINPTGIDALARFLDFITTPTHRALGFLADWDSAAYSE